MYKSFFFKGIFKCYYLQLEFTARTQQGSCVSDDDTLSVLKPRYMRQLCLELWVTDAAAASRPVGKWMKALL